MIKQTNVQTSIRPKYVFFTLLDFFLTENVLFLLVLWFSEDDAVLITEQLVHTCSGRICEVLLSPLRTQRDITGPNSESCCGWQQRIGCRSFMASATRWRALNGSRTPTVISRENALICLWSASDLRLFYRRALKCVCEAKTRTKDPVVWTWHEHNMNYKQKTACWARVRLGLLCRTGLCLDLRAALSVPYSVEYRWKKDLHCVFLESQITELLLNLQKMCKHL